MSTEPPGHQPHPPRGPVALVVGLLVLLGAVVAVVAVMVVLLLRDEPEQTRAVTSVVEFRRVTALLPDACSTEGPSSVTPSATPGYCGKDGNGYQLGPAELDRSNVVKASAERDAQTVAWLVRLTLDEDGKAKLARLTTELAGKPQGENLLAIVVDGRVISAPAVAGPITGGVVDISANFTESQARQMVTEITG